jgi:hypothetical protein
MISSYCLSCNVKIKRDTPLPEQSAKILSVAMTRNEYEAAQLIFRSDEAFTVEDISVTELRCGESIIPKADIIVSKQNYINVFLTFSEGITPPFKQ